MELLYKFATFQISEVMGIQLKVDQGIVKDEHGLIF